jgi:DNA-binding NarL/FixJ family response regulator
MHSANRTAGIGQVPQHTLKAVLKLAQCGLSPEDIASILNIDIETVYLIIANNPMHRARVVQQLKSQDHQSPPLHEDTLPSSTATRKTLTSCTGLG